MLYAEKFSPPFTWNSSIRNSVENCLIDEVPNLNLLEKRIQLLQQTTKTLLFFESFKDEVVAFVQTEYATIDRYPTLNRLKKWLYRRFVKNCELGVLELKNWGVTSKGYFPIKKDSLEIDLIFLDVARYFPQYNLHFMRFGVEEGQFHFLVEVDNIFDHFFNFVPTHIFKYYSRYESYIQSLENLVQESIQKLWNKFNDKTRFQIRKYQNYEELKEHFDLGTWSNFFPHPHYINMLQGSPFIFISIEEKFKPEMILLFLEGQSGRMFVEFFHNKKSNYPDRRELELYALQYAIMIFYKVAHYQKLLFLNAKDYSSMVVESERYKINTVKKMTITQSQNLLITQEMKKIHLELR